MVMLKVGDVVARKSYGYDVLFRVSNIYDDMVDLVGMTVRIIADAPIYDLKIMSPEEINKAIKTQEDHTRIKVNRCYSNLSNRFNFRDRVYYNTQYNNQFKQVGRVDVYQKESIYKKPGVIMHLDGDAEYAVKCKETYKKMGLVAHAYHVKESEQPKDIYNMLTRVRPNILVMTGHDAFIRKRNDIYNIDNYKNSRYFIEAVLEARRYEHNLDNLVIFAGACQSYYEAILSAGANFASAPKRVLIDMLDPIIVAESVAYTPVDKFVPLAGIIANTREGLKGIGGVQTRGQYREGMPGL